MNARRLLIPLALSGVLAASAVLTPTQVAVAETEPGKHAVTGTVTDGQGALSKAPSRCPA